MRFTAERDNILSALSFVAKYAAAKETIPILTHILLRSDGDRVVVSATDLDRAAQDSFAADISSTGAFCLPSELLLKSIKSASGSEVEISSDAKQATTSCGQAKFKFPVLLASDFPEVKMLSAEPVHSFELPGETLHRARSAVGFSVSTETRSRWYLCGTSWVVNGDALELCATDGSKLSLLSIAAPVQGMPAAIVPEFDIPSWEGSIKVSLTDHFIRYQSGSQTLTSKLIEGSFPEYRRVIPKHKNSIRFDRAEMLAAVIRARLVADAREHSILFAGRDGNVTVSAVTTRGEVSGNVAYDGDDFRIAIASGVIAPILQSFGCEVVEMRLSDAGSPVSIHDPNDDSRITVAMPYYDARVAREAA